MTDGLKNDIRNLVNFHASSRKSEKVHFDGLVISKGYEVLDKKNYRRVRSQDTEERYFLRNMHFLCDAIGVKQSGKVL